MAAYQAYPPAPPAKKKKRVFLWVFLAFQVLFLIWIIAGAGSASKDTGDCGSLSAETCQSARDAGTAIGVGIIIFLWAAVDVILGIGYGVYRLAKRPAA